MNIAQGVAFEAATEFGVTGLLAAARLRVEDNQGNIVVASRAFDRELGTTGVYAADMLAIGSTGQYTILSTSDGSYDPGTVASEDLVIYSLVAPDGPPPVPVSGTGGLCSSWITGEDVAACCSVETSSDLIFDTVAEEASEMLFSLSGRQFPGECEKTVMPPCDPCSCGYQVLARGFVVGPFSGWGNWGGYWGGYCDSCLIGCEPSAVKLSGYPVQAISQVKINGDVLASDKYALRQNRYLVRLDDGHWPWGNDLTLADTEEGTWSVTYTYGGNPPSLGQSAAAQLACELYKACVPGSGACALPTGVTRVTRQGVTIERLAFTTWAYTPVSRARGGRTPGWTTGMALVDAFLNTYNSTGRLRTPVFWSPGKRQYARRVGA